MKIAFLTTSYPRFEGDYTGFISGLCEKLSEKHYKIKVIAPHNRICKCHEIVNKVEIFRPRYAPIGLEVLAYGSGITDNLRKNLFSRIILPFFIVSYLNKSYRVSKDCDLIHAHWTFCGFIAVILKFLLKKPVILTVHGSDLAVFPKFFNKFVLKKVDQIITVSNYLKEEIVKMDIEDKKITVIHNGIPNLKKLLKIPLKESNDFRILWIGRFIEAKNPDLLVSAFKMILNKVPRAKLVLVYFYSPHANSLENKIRNKVKKLKINRSVLFEGEKKSDELLKYFVSSDLLVLPSQREGFGVVLIEAMAAARPVLGSSQGGILDIIEDNKNGLLFKSNDRNDLAQKIITILKDKKLRDRLAVEGRKTAIRKFSWQRIVNATIRIYKKV